MIMPRARAWLGAEGGRVRGEVDPLDGRSIIGGWNWRFVCSGSVISQHLGPIGCWPVFVPGRLKTPPPGWLSSLEPSWPRFPGSGLVGSGPGNAESLLGSQPASPRE
ncbi:hypothetical protein B0T16DRAFT_396837, partial [Cercophora newfieldiana]